MHVAAGNQPKSQGQILVRITAPLSIYGERTKAWLDVIDHHPIRPQMWSHGTPFPGTRFIDIKPQLGIPALHWCKKHVSLK